MNMSCTFFALFLSHFSHYILWYIVFRCFRTYHYEDRIYDSFPLRENTDQRKLLFWYIIGNVWSKLLSASKLFLLFLFSSNSFKCSDIKILAIIAAQTKCCTIALPHAAVCWKMQYFYVSLERLKVWFLICFRRLRGDILKIS